ncbi:MAG: DUF1501 domain-containing protein [Planctomycetota bacterium]|jgi:hypothetical protein
MSRDSEPQTTNINRRTLLASAGLAAAGLSGIRSAIAASSSDAKFGQPHIRPRARNIVWLFMSGGPSQVDSFDPKPTLTKLDGQDVPESIAKTLPRLKEASLFNLMASPYRFRQHGESGLPVSDLFPETAKHIDRLCVIRSMRHGTPVHGPGECVALTGTALGDRPSLGAWVSLGVGTQNHSLPGFIVMNLLTSGMQYPQVAGWGPGFLPAEHQGVVVDPVKGIRDLTLPPGTSTEMRQRQLSLLDFLNRRHVQSLVQHSELEARIRSYGTAFRMQTHAPELLALDQETEETQRRYGMLEGPTQATGRSLLLTRRMVERGVRFIQVRIGGWDAHGNLKGNHNGMAAKTDRPVAAFLEDLDQRGLLDETLVVWGGEFGRTPTMEGLNNGRNHNPLGYTVWLAGGGIKGGQAIGATDELGYAAVARPVSISDFHATLLHGLGIDQNQLVWHHHGRDEIPTNLGGQVLQDAYA